MIWVEVAVVEVCRLKCFAGDGYDGVGEKDAAKISWSGCAV